MAYFTKDHPDFLPKATSFVLLGGVFSALLGPLLSNITRYMITGADFAGSFLQISIMYFFFGVLAWFADFQVPPSKNRESDELDETLDMLLIGAEDERNENIQERNKSLIEFLKQTDLALLTVFQCLSYNVMALYGAGAISFT